MTSTYAIRIWENDKSYSDGWEMSLHSSFNKAMIQVIKYMLVDFEVQQYYDEDDDSTANCHVSSVIDTVHKEFEKCGWRCNFLFEVKNPSAPFKRLLFDVREVKIN